MKKFIAAVLPFIMLCSPVSTAMAESGTAIEQQAPIDSLTIENCPDLAAILESKSPSNDELADFASAYAGQTVEFDGNIASIFNHGDYKTRYDILVYAGDYSETSVSGPNFQFSDVGVIDLGLSGLWLPDFVAVGSNIHVIATVGEYKEISQLFMLDPILIEERQLDTTEAAQNIVEYTLLEKGSKGDDVKALQQRLIELCYLAEGSADGDYGKKTKTAVERFQDAANLDVTGIADEATQAALFAEKAPENSLSISCSSVVLGSSGTTSWYVDGQEFTLRGNKTKTIKTPWGTYKFDALGNYNKLDD